MGFVNILKSRPTYIIALKGVGEGGGGEGGGAGGHEPPHFQKWGAQVGLSPSHFWA